MTIHTYSAPDPVLYPAGSTTEGGGSAVSWSAVTAGTVAAIALTITLLTLGSAFGLGSVSPWPGVGARPTTFTIGAGLWLVITQWLSAAVGGYLAGRLRVRWHGLHTDEVFSKAIAGYPSVFAHGMLTMGMTGHMVTDLVGDGRLTEFGGRFTSQVYPGDDLTTTARVEAINAVGGEPVVELSLSTVNQDGAEVFSGHATARVDP